jgi:hemolysin D
MLEPYIAKAKLLYSRLAEGYEHYAPILIERYQTQIKPKLIEKLAPLKAKVQPYIDRYLRPYSEKAFKQTVTFIRSFEKTDPETAFYPAALEVLEEPPSPLGRAVSLVICAFFLFAVLWATFGRVDIIATAQGKIIPTGRTKIIQPLEAGVVRSIHVQDGQEVKAGDVLIEIDSTISEAERDRLQKELTAEQLNVARLRAALKMSEDPLADFVPPEGATAQQIETAKSQLSNQVQEIRSKLSSLDQQIMQNEGSKAAVTATIDKLTKSIPMLKERAKVRKYLSDKGYGSKIDTLTSEQDLVEHEEELHVQEGRLMEATGAVASYHDQRQQAESEYKHKNLDDLREAEQKASSLQEQLIQATKKFRLQTLTTPVDGTVQQLAIHTEGGVVTPAQALLMVVPADSHLEIEAMVSNKDIGFVHEDEEAEVKIDTFNFTKYGFIHGKVISVSHDAITREKPQGSGGSNSNKSQVGAENETSEPNGQELVYAARISMDKSQMMIDDRLVSLSPGMAVTAEIKTGSRRVIEYLLSPLFKHKQQALHER